VGGIALTIPRVLDVYLIQYFFGIYVVGLYAPAKTIFRFVEDLIQAIYTTIYAPVVKCFANNDIIGVNSIISKSISLLVLFFGGITLFC
jgi:O-antigen/teichoic acid export membrane protein